MSEQQVREFLAEQILRRIAERYKNCDINIFPDFPEMSPVEAVLRCAQEEGFKLTSIVPAAPTDPYAKLEALLAKHWLYEMNCDHANRRDNAVCACGWVSDSQATVGDAAKAWANHAITELRAGSKKEPT